MPIRPGTGRKNCGTLSKLGAQKGLYRGCYEPEYVVVRFCISRDPLSGRNCCPHKAQDHAARGGLYPVTQETNIFFLDDALARVARERSRSSQKISMDSPYEGFEQSVLLLDTAPSFLSVHISDSVIAEILYASRTKGKPKGRFVKPIPHPLARGYTTEISPHS